MVRDMNIFTLKTYVHNKNIFPMSIITTGSDDRKLTFSALNWHWKYWLLKGQCQFNAQNGSFRSSLPVEFMFIGKIVKISFR